MNPYGAMSFGSKPSEIKLVRLADASNKTGAWQTRYERTIPAGGEISIAVAYVHDFDQASTIDKWIAADVLISSPAIAIDAPADGSTIDGASAHVTGTASSPDGELAVNVNGAAAAVTADGHWSADVPLSEGANQIMAVARNDIGVTTTAVRSVTRPAAPAPAATPASAAVTVAA